MRVVDRTSSSPQLLRTQATLGPRRQEVHTFASDNPPQATCPEPPWQPPSSESAPLTKRSQAPQPSRDIAALKSPSEGQKRLPGQAIRRVPRRSSGLVQRGDGRLVERQTRRRQRRSGAEKKSHERIVAHLGSARASAVRADRRRTVSGDVRRAGRFRLSHDDSVGRCRAGSDYRVGLQVGGRGFESRTLHLQKNLFAGLSSARFPPPATAVRARCERTADSCRAQLSEVESGAFVDRSRVASSSGAGLTRP
jgi:hypothetical protein